MTPTRRHWVTVALPIYKRLEYLPQALKTIESQDYPFIELLVSDNGMNGDKVREAVQSGYSRPHRFRQNPTSVEIIAHFNQLVHEATGEYFVILCDDDEISPNYVSELVRQLEAHPEAAIAFSGQEVIDVSGQVLKASVNELPEIVSGSEFILATWKSAQFGFKSVSAFVARTARMKAVGGYPSFTRGTHPDDAMVVMLCLENHVLLNSKCVWRNRLYDSSYGMSLPIDDLAAATREFLEFLDSNPTIGKFAACKPAEWARLKACLVKMAWRTYHSRWSTMYRRRMPFLHWVRAAFALPYIPAYYKSVGRSFMESLRAQARHSDARPPVRKRDKFHHPQNAREAHTRTKLRRTN